MINTAQLVKDEVAMTAYLAELEAIDVPGAVDEVKRLRTALRQIEDKAPHGQDGHALVKARLGLAERRLRALGGAPEPGAEPEIETVEDLNINWLRVPSGKVVMVAAGPIRIGRGAGRQVYARDDGTIAEVTEDARAEVENSVIGIVGRVFRDSWIDELGRHVAEVIVGG